MAAEAYEPQMLIKLESGRILPTALPTRMWTGPGPILLDIGDGAGSVQWNGTSFGNTETETAVEIEKTAEGVPKRLSVSVGVDGERDDVRAAITGSDHGPLTTTLLFIVRETAGASLPQQQWSFDKLANADPEPTLSVSSGNQMLYIGNDTFKITMFTDYREAFRNILVEGNRMELTGDAGGVSGQTADAEIVYASVETGTAFDVWTITADGHGSFTEASTGNTLLRAYDPPKDQDWSFITDAAGAPLVVRGRTGEMAYAKGMWTFEVENRVHDADRLLVDIWSDAVQQGAYSGDRFFEFAASIEAGLDISWPN